VQEGARSRERGELRDPRAHRPGAGDANRLRSLGHEGGESNDFAALYL
jgi:hypothetical protein